MADHSEMTDFEYISKNFDRLLGKPGVKAILVLDRETGNVLKTGGNTDLFRKESSESSKPSISNDAPSDGAAEPSTADREGVVELATLVWNYVDVTEQFVQDLNKEDTARLQRLRTATQELVIITDPKFILAVAHDKPNSG
uniref:Roadblock/LAMTOR2 domain-containing protein n=2 Tax=Podospora anserina TaxID=2587412 RepID=A0A090CAP1_PODAN|nr:Putative protein of unknown function [Podospora anserina]CDP24371.1 Putative protein of unknown function [Podospora anserina S mat+]